MLRPRSRQRLHGLHGLLVERLRAHIAEARLGVGDRLPSGRELAERHGVSRAFIKQAILVLEVQGLVDVRHGGGTYLRRDDITVNRLTPSRIAGVDALREDNPMTRLAQTADLTDIQQEISG